MDKNESTILTCLYENKQSKSKDIKQELDNLNINNLTNSLNS